MAEPAHIPVMLAEVVQALAPAPGRLIIDATFGAGGYSRALLQSGARVLALDRDPSAERFSPQLTSAYPDRFHLALQPFSRLEQALIETGCQSCDGVVFDLGVSSMQLDEAERGFSFLRDGPLDMRMGASGQTAADLVNTCDPGELVRLFRLYGEEPKARRIVAALVRRREITPFVRTLELAEVVEQAVGGRRAAPTHPATRVFQALRIAVNEELTELEAALAAAERALSANSRLVVVAFHSLEDRIVKRFLTERTGRLPAASRHRPPLDDGPRPSFQLIVPGAQPPMDAETTANPRARSAKLRAAVRTDAPAWSAGAAE